MTVPLRIRVLCLVAAMNAALFTVGGFAVYDRLRAANDAQLQYLVETLDVLGARVRSNIDPQGSLNVAPILQWDAWSILDDAVLVGNEGLDVRPDGEIVPSGIHLNPIGKSRRAATFDLQGVLRAILDAIRIGRPVPIEGGRALPILTGAGAWGGCWIRLQPPVDIPGMLRNLLPLFLLSTLILTAGTFWLLGRLVVSPVETLAEGAKRIRGGDFTTHLDEPRRHDELADLVRSFNSMTSFVRRFNDHLEEEVRLATAKARKAEAAAMTQRRLAAMGELAAGIAHEINNPLGGLQNAVEALRRGDVTRERRERYLKLLSQGLQRIEETVRRLQRFTPRAAEHQELDLASVVRDAVELVRHRATREGIAVELEMAAREVVRVEGSATEVGQAILNLLSNALDALEERGSGDSRGPRVLVRVERTEGGALLEVRDNGPGASPAELERVQDLFYTTKEVGKGSGLGLALVHRAMRDHGGSVEIKSEPGVFFSVVLRFPAGGRREEEPG